jgi:SAM-dependent methyltransferase
MGADFDALEDAAKAYYEGRLCEHGPTPRGADWNSSESQELRFRQLFRLIDRSEPMSVLDFGCGYGALAGFLARDGFAFEYLGYDISPAMVDAARETFRDEPRASFTSSVEAAAPADYAVASGVLNVKLGAGADEWLAYTLDVLRRLDALSSKGLAFNMLTSYSDVHRRREDLYYGDPSFYFDFCKRTLSGRVALLHDYPLYEFTIFVRKE